MMTKKTKFKTVSLDDLAKEENIMSTKFVDRKLRCKERKCRAYFIFTKEEQAYFWKKGYDKPPRRCAECRRKRREALDRKRADFERAMSKAKPADDKPVNGKPVEVGEPKVLSENKE